MDEGDLACIKADDVQWLKNCFRQVFTKWHNGMTSDYSWKKVAEALESDAIGQKILLENLYTKLKQQK